MPSFFKEKLKICGDSFFTIGKFLEKKKIYVAGLPYQVITTQYR